MRAGRSGPMVIRQRRRFHSLVRPELASALASMNIHAPNVVQAAALRRALSGADLLCVAQTGSGKTLMFLLPLLERLQAGGAAVVVAPSRVLADQHAAVAAGTGRCQS